MKNTKVCSKCNLEKDLKEFWINKTENRIHSFCKRCLYDSQILRWKDRKRKAIELLGGKCTVCGYCKNMAAMHFHHVNPKDKEFNWDKLRETKWETIITELKKCILLCGNCHAEHHWPNENTDFTIQSYLNKSLDGKQLLLKSTGNCPICQKELFGTKYCSTNCSQLSCRKVVRPSKEELEKLIWKKPTLEVAKQFGVSDVAVAKWCKFYNINKPPRGYWAKIQSKRYELIEIKPVKSE